MNPRARVALGFALILLGSLIAVFSLTGENWWVGLPIALVGLALLFFGRKREPDSRA